MMQLIILGYVPGTSIQITFENIAYLIALATVLYLCWLWRKEEQFLKQKFIETINAITI
jgi:hypothetical protein